jgi:uncharacterized protein (TIGR02757 family)
VPRHIPVRDRAVLKSRLDELVATLDISTIAPDPLQVVLRFSDPLDQEVTGLIAAAFAYGRADIVVRNVTWIVERMTPAPHAYLAQSFSTAEAMDRFAGFSHRFHKTADLVALLERMARIIRRFGSLGHLFRAVYQPHDTDIAESLQRFVEAIIGDAPDKPLRYLLTSPADGSACKRMNLFMRWMVRRESPDLGLWRFVDPATLVMPVDTHIHRISTFLGLTKRKSADWKTARDLTDRLKAFDAADPVRYDFAICRLGILDLCSRKRRKENCDVCLLRDVCGFPFK